jgi:hypothetical protein
MENFLNDYIVIKEMESEGKKIIVVEKKVKKETAQQRYYKKNKEKINSYVAEWRRKKMDTDEEFRSRQKDTKKRFNERMKDKDIVKERYFLILRKYQNMKTLVCFHINLSCC